MADSPFTFHQYQPTDDSQEWRHGWAVVVVAHPDGGVSEVTIGIDANGSIDVHVNASRANAVHFSQG